MAGFVFVLSRNPKGILVRSWTNPRAFFLRAQQQPILSHALFTTATHLQTAEIMSISFARTRFHQTRNSHQKYPSVRNSVSFPTRCFLSKTSSEEFTVTAQSSSTSAGAAATTPLDSNTLLPLRRQVEEAVELTKTNLASSSTTSPEILQRQIADLEREQSEPGFWDSPTSTTGSSGSSRSNSDDDASNASSAKARTAAVVNQQLSDATRLLARINQWQQYQDDAVAALEMLQDMVRDTTNQAESVSSSSSSSSSGDDSSVGPLPSPVSYSQDEIDMLVEEIETSSRALLEDGQRYALELLLSGPYDHLPARLTLTAGAGGTEANDWVSDLKRMYERYVSKKADEGFRCQVEETTAGDVTGYKSVQLLITGPNAFGWFQGEKGAHRLVRLSPFNANNKRQTTFCGVDVAPEVYNNEDELKDIDVPEQDLEITAMRAGGKGGQNVNKVNSAVRIKHLPSGLQVKCTEERSQSMNKAKALNRLKVQLLAIAREQRVQEIKEIRGDIVEASWGAQIRNYVLHPYKMVKDQRTGWETGNTQAFLDGEMLDDCIGSFLRHKADKEGEEAMERKNS